MASAQTTVHASPLRTVRKSTTAYPKEISKQVETVERVSRPEVSECPRIPGDLEG